MNRKEMNQITSLLDAQKRVYNNDSNTITFRNPYKDMINYGNLNWAMTKNIDLLTPVVYTTTSINLREPNCHSFLKQCDNLNSSLFPESQNYGVRKSPGKIPNVGIPGILYWDNDDTLFLLTDIALPAVETMTPNIPERTRLYNDHHGIILV